MPGKKKGKGTLSRNKAGKPPTKKVITMRPGKKGGTRKKKRNSFILGMKKGLKSSIGEEEKAKPFPARGGEEKSR